MVRDACLASRSCVELMNYISAGSQVIAKRSSRCDCSGAASKSC